MLSLYQPDVALTDFLLALETIVLALVIIRLKKRYRLNIIIFLFYISLALSSLIGGTVHGFFPQSGSLGNLILWKATMVSLGLVTLFSWVIVGTIILPRYNRAILCLASLWFFLYSAYVIFVNSQFKIAIYNYIPATILFLISLFYLYFKSKRHTILLGVIGILLTFLSSWIQQNKIDLHPVYFNHNATYHLIQMFALLFIFIAFKFILKSDQFSSYIEVKK